MKIKPFQAVYADTAMIASPQSFYDTVKEEYQEYKKSDYFKKSSQPAFYIYQISSPNSCHIGLGACIDISEIEENKVLKHEQTLAEKEQKMINLFLQRKAMIKPVLFTYPPQAEIKEILTRVSKDSRPFHEVFFEKNQETHKLWAILDKNTQEDIKRIFAENIPRAYIADGHHRCSTTLYLHKSFKKKKKKDLKFDQLLSLFFDFEELKVYDYNRIVEALEDISPLALMAKLSAKLNLDILPKPRKPLQKHELTMCIEREWFSLTWKDHILQKYKGQPVVFDAELLNKEIFQDILGVSDVRIDSRIEYIEGVKDLDYFQHKVLKKNKSIGFCLFPVALDEVCLIAESGMTMPPKSTWFEPRIKNGMIIHEL